MMRYAGPENSEMADAAAKRLGLSRQEFVAASLYLYDHRTQEEIAERLDVSQQRVAAILAAAKEKLAAVNVFWPKEDKPARRVRQLREAI